MSGTLQVGWGAAWALPVLVVVAAGLAAAGGLGLSTGIVTASVRATVQLAAVGLVVAAALASLPRSAGFVLLMTAVAAATSSRRLGRPAAWLPATAVAIGLPTAVVLAVLLGSGALPADPAALLPAGGIFTGGAMMAVTLTGRRLLADLRQRTGEVEAALALGLTPRQAVREIAGRTAAAEALVHALDQTRTVGLVILPGAFIGMVLGGATPSQAAAVQLIVLVGLLAAETAAALATAELVAGAVGYHGRLRPPRRLTRKSPAAAR